MLVVLFTTFVVAGLAFGLLQETSASRVAVDTSEGSLRALELCEFAVARASSEIRPLKDTSDDGIGNVSGAFAGGRYQAVAVQDPVLLDRWTVTVTGRSRHASRRIEVGLRRRGSGLFQEALFAKDEMKVSGDVQTDAYDSRLGSYASQATNSDAQGSYAQVGGHLGSNADILLSGSDIWVRGDAVPGPLGEVEVSGFPVVQGDTTPRSTEVLVPDPPRSEFETAYATNANGTWTVVRQNVKYEASKYALTIDGQGHLRLPGGTYFFSSITVSGQGLFEVTGPVKIYLTGEFDQSGGSILNATGIASNLMVIAHPYALPPTQPPPSVPHHDLSGGGNVTMAFYAPGGILKLSGDTNLFGAAIAQAVDVSGSAYFHYDKALGEGAAGIARLDQLYWREPVTPTR